MYKILLLFLFTCTLSACDAQESKKETVKFNPIFLEGKLDTAYLANGCFWCSEAVFYRTRGVIDVVPGYSGGTEDNPSYRLVAGGKTGYAEAIRVIYDKEQISYEDLLLVFFGTHDPTQLNRQGPDIGRQYRSAIFYKDKEQQRIAEALIKELNNLVYMGDIVTEVTEFSNFYIAEEEHHGFYEQNPNHPYIKQVSRPIIHSLEKNFPQYLKQETQKDKK